MENGDGNQPFRGEQSKTNGAAGFTENQNSSRCYREAEEDDNWRSNRHYNHNEQNGRNGNDSLTLSTSYSVPTNQSNRYPDNYNFDGTMSQGQGNNLVRTKESVRDIFLRQVRDALLKDITPTPSASSSTEKKLNTEPSELSRVNILPKLKPKPVEVEAKFHPEMSSDSQILDVAIGVFGKLNPIKPESRRDTLLDQLSNCTYECMVCCGKVYHRQSIWNCQNCFNAFHLHCVKRWSASSAIQGEWRCPGCQNIVDYYPKYYYCYCGNMKNPPYSSSGVPHSCGNSCRKKKSSREDCSHFCILPCHPGPCEDCTSMVNRKCCCGKSTAFVQCQSKASVLCGNTCGKVLNCGVHSCQASCHAGDCGHCDQTVTLDCHCGRNKKTLPCSAEANFTFRPKYSCELQCNNLLNCKNHRCPRPCHPNHCDPCKTSVDVIVSCPCGQTSIAEACRKNGLPIRTSCLHEIPSCGKVCSKILSCGPYDAERHRCTNTCHSDDKPCACPLVTEVPCRCGTQQIELSCSEYVPGAELTCQRRCNKKRSCGRHKCNTKCCIDPDHLCTIVCNKMLSCGNHRCESLCHFGHCKLCPNVSFDELRCECGEAILYPPVPCGTAPPSCDKPCLRVHQCEHPVHHQCHTEPNCPPCPFLTEKWCYGKHELRKNIPCYNNNVSCGMPCGKRLQCGRHKCPKICHAGDCESEGETCKLKCGSRIKCGHPCSAPCHTGSCPEIVCRLMTEVGCPCGRRKEVMLCCKRQAEFERVISEAVSQELNDAFKNEGEAAQNEPTVEEIVVKLRTSKNISIVLTCDKECARVERLRKIAEALQLHNPDPETRIGPPNYSDFLKKFAQKSPQFVEMVHEKLGALVMQTKKSPKKNITFAFDSMNRDKRTVIHEYSDHFGIQSESFDEEPNRNVIVTASKDKCWLPSVSLVDVVFRKPVVSQTGRKNVYQDLELTEPPKTKIIGPANLSKYK